MATRKSVSAAQQRRYKELRQLGEMCFHVPSSPTPPAVVPEGLLGCWPPHDKGRVTAVQADDRPRAFLAEFKQLPAFVWLSSQANYAEAVRGLETRRKQTKGAKYNDVFAEIALVRSFASPLLAHEIWTQYPLENTFPTAAELRAIRKTSNDLRAALRKYSGLQSTLEPYDVQLHLTQFIERIDLIKRSYRKPRADGDQLGRAFARSVAVALKKEFDEAALVILAPLCALVNYSPHITDLRMLARQAIRDAAKVVAR